MEEQLEGGEGVGDLKERPEDDDIEVLPRLIPSA
jgi:hypothetical protein